MLSEAKSRTAGLNQVACPGLSGKSPTSRGKRLYWLIIISLILVPSSLAQINIPAGEVSGTWTSANSPYHIDGEITIPNDSTLTIEPGVEVVFMGHYKFNVQGRLLAVGTQQDSIRFTAQDRETGWHGIRFFQTPNTNDTSEIVYCSFKYGKANTGSGFDRCGGAILINAFDKVLVSNCLFESNMNSGEGWSPVIEGGAVIYVYLASSIITNNTFSNNSGSKGSAVACITCPNVIVSNNVFSNNSGTFAPIVYASNSSGTISGNIISNNVAAGSFGGGGIWVDNYFFGDLSPRIINNVIVHNQAPKGGGIGCYVNANPVLINNTIAYNSAGNGGGIYCYGNSNPIIINNILFGNSATSSGQQVFIDDNGSNPIFKYCDVQGAKEGFAGTGSGANYTEAYENNIDSDPLFVDTEDDFRLTNLSPCLGAGVSSIEIGGVLYNVPAFCIMGNPRPSPTGSRPDIGACESLLGSLVGVEQEVAFPAEFVLHQNYPNPFNPATTISFSLPRKSFVSLKVFDASGREVAVLLAAELSAGTYSRQWNPAGLASGVYFYRLQAGLFSETRKLILLR
jgi:hypothetical protein